MKTRRFYEHPEIITIKFSEKEDVITTSGLDNSNESLLEDIWDEYIWGE